MKKIILIGTIACGKTTLCQRINGLKQEYKKTQTMEVINQTIDTPGEYLEHRAFWHGLFVASVETDTVVFVIDPTQERYMFSPGQGSGFPVPVIGVVTKADIADEKQIETGTELLKLAGADPVFVVSSLEGSGMDELMAYLEGE